MNTLTARLMTLALAAGLASGCGDENENAPPATDAGPDASGDSGDTDTDTGTAEDDVPPDLPDLCEVLERDVPGSGDRDSQHPDLAVGTSALVVFGYDDGPDMAADAGVADWDIRAEVYDPDAGPMIPGVEPSPDTALGRSPAMAARGSEFGLVWLDGRFDPACTAEDQDACVMDVVFLAVGSDGLPPGGPAPSRITTGADVRVRPSIAATASGYVVVWSEGVASPRRVMVSALDPAGDATAAVQISGDEGISQNTRPIAAAIGDTALVAWLPEDQRSVLARAIGGDGEPIDEAIAVDEDVLCSQPGLAAGPDGFLVSWSRETAGELEVHTRRLDATGVPAGDAVRVTWVKGDVTYSTPAWGDGRWALVWHALKANGEDQCAVSTCQSRVYFGLLDAEGAMASRPVDLSQDPNDCKFADLAWDGGGWTAVWQLWRTMRWQIRYGRAACAAE